MKLLSFSMHYVPWEKGYLKIQFKFLLKQQNRWFFKYLQDNQLIEATKDILNGASKQLYLEVPVVNSDRAFGTTLSYHIARWINTMLWLLWGFIWKQCHTSSVATISLYLTVTPDTKIDVFLSGNLARKVFQMAPFTSKQQGLQVSRVQLKYKIIKLLKK